jgi:hypothetical protein
MESVMKDIFNNNGGGFFDGNSLEGKSLKELIAAFGPLVLMRLEEFDNPMLRTMMAMQIEGGIQSLAAALQNGELDGQIAEASAKIQAASFQQIEAEVNKAFSATTDEASAEAVRKSKVIIKGMTEDECVALAKGIYSILPDRVEKIMTLIATGGTGNLEEEVRQGLRLSEEALVQKRIERSKQLPKEALVAAIYEITQKATPENIKVFLTEVSVRLKPDDVAGVAFNGADFIRDVIETVLRDNSFNLQNPAKAAEFRGNIKAVLTVVQDSLIAAGITPDTDIEAEVRKAYAAGVNQNQAPALQAKIKKATPKGNFKL